MEQETCIPRVEKVIASVRITGVNSVFRLSLNSEFRASLESVAAPSVGRNVELKDRNHKLVVEFSGYNGKCEVNRDGSVRCYAQRSFEEAEFVAKKLVWEFCHTAKQEVGLFHHQYVVVTLKSRLPFHVNLNKMRSYYPDITEFEPELSSFAIIRYPNLGATINLYVSGRLTMWCNGDCKPPDYDMSHAVRAVEQIGTFASAFMLADSLLDLEENEGVDDSEESLHCRGLNNHVRRSERLAALDDNEKANGSSSEDEPESLSNLTTATARAEEMKRWITGKRSISATSREVMQEMLERLERGSSESR